MPEDAPAVDETTQDAPEPSDPQTEAPATESETTQPAEVDYEKRYTDLRSQYDKIHPRYNQYEQFIESLTNPDTQAEALRALGLQLDDEGDLEDYDEDDTDPTESRLDQLENYLAEQAEEAAAKELQDLEAQYLEQEIGKLDADLSAKEKKAIENLAKSTPDEDGIPDVEAAYEVFKEATDANLERYRESKKAPRPGNGQAGIESIDMSDDDARAQFLADAIEAGEAA